MFDLKLVFSPQFEIAQCLPSVFRWNLAPAPYLLQFTGSHFGSVQGDASSADSIIISLSGIQGKEITAMLPFNASQYSEVIVDPNL